MINDKRTSTPTTPTAKTPSTRTSPPGKGGQKNYTPEQMSTITNPPKPTHPKKKGNND